MCGGTDGCVGYSWVVSVGVGVGMVSAYRHLLSISVEYLGIILKTIFYLLIIAKKYHSPVQVD